MKSRNHKKHPKAKSNFNAHAVRFAAPFTIKCTSCNEYIYKNKRFNAIKETAVGEDYLGVEVYRFYIKCTGCRITLTLKTDPKNSTYIPELGCVCTETEPKKNQNSRDKQSIRSFDSLKCTEERSKELVDEVKRNSELETLRKDMFVMSGISNQHSKNNLKAMCSARNFLKRNDA